MCRDIRINIVAVEMTETNVETTDIKLKNKKIEKSKGGTSKSFLPTQKKVDNKSKDPRKAEMTINNRGRRANGEGSIFPILKDGEIKRFGYCLQLGKTPNGERLRCVETAKTREVVEEKLAIAKSNWQEKRNNKLKQLGYKIDEE